MLLKNLKNSKSVSIDGLDNYSVKVSHKQICRPVHHLITLSLMQCKFPTSWRYSKLVPLHKKGSKLDMRNYRPVALLSPISKVLERLVFEQMYRHFHGNKIFHTNLHGYRKYRSTQTALITIYDRWVRSASRGKLSGAVLLDLSAAFDLVDHHLLLQKLKIYGLQKDCLDWLTSYLGGRYQAVWIDHQLSEFLNCDVGVPQGSILGPLLFLLYLNDLPEILESQADSYADDTTLTATGDSIQEVEEKLTRDGCKVSLWMKSNRLKLNPQKTHLLTIGTQRKLATLPRKLLVQMDGVLLDENSSGCE